MNYRIVTKTFLDVAELYRQDTAEANRYLNEYGTYTRLKEMHPGVDARDFVPMVLLMGIKGDTREDRDTDIHNKLDKITTAFEDPDLSERDDYLDLIYYLLDDFAVNFDPITMNMSDPDQVGKLLQSMLISQTIKTKRDENPDYYRRRYPTPEARNLADARDRFRGAVSSAVAANLSDNGIDFDIGLSLPKPFPKEAQEIQHLREAYEKDRLDKAIAAKGSLPKSQIVDLPIADSMVPCIGTDIGDIQTYPKAVYAQVSNYYRIMAENTLLQNTQGLQETGIGNAKEALYIDGQPFAEFMKAHFPKEIPDETADAIAGACILSGKHHVDIVNAYRDEAGQMQYEAKTIRATVTPEQEKLYMQQFSWLRRLFNRGPFRMESLQERMDRIVTDPKTEERLSAVTEDHKAKIAKKPAKEQERKAEKKQQAQRLTAYKEATARLEASVARWDKNSVMGILGRQIIGACDAIRKELADNAPAERYEKVAPLFAKVVLYSQLSAERTANGGNPGETEKTLGNSNTIKENIQNTSALLAKNPVFQTLFLEKTGVAVNSTLYPDSANFEAMIGSGGCERFCREYLQKLKDMPNRKEQQAPSAEKALENRKQAKTPKVGM